MEQTATQPRKSDSWLPTGEPAKKSKLLPLKSVNIVSKQSRQKAKATTCSKYERIRKGLAIGWRMNTNRQGSWTARRMTPDGYQFGVIGHSDEAAPADGVTVFSYDQAEAACVAWAANADSRAAGGPWRVRDAAKDWLDIPSTKGGSNDAGRSNVKNWINPMLGDVPVVDLTKAQLQKFLHDKSGVQLCLLKLPLLNLTTTLWAGHSRGWDAFTSPQQDAPPTLAMALGATD